VLCIYFCIRPSFSFFLFLFDFSDFYCTTVLLFDLSGLDEVGLHVSLEVEIRKLIVGAELEEGNKLGIGDNDAAVGLGLKAVGLDVLVDLGANLSARHLGADLLAEESGKLVADASGLLETSGLANTGGFLLARRGLLGVLELTRNGLLELLELGLHRDKEVRKLLKLSVEGSELVRHGGNILGGSIRDSRGDLDGSGGRGDNRSRGRSRSRSSSGGSLLLLRGGSLGLLLLNGSRGSDRGRGGSRGRRSGFR